MKPSVLEGLWDDIVAQRTELRGKRVRVIVLSDESLTSQLSALQETSGDLTEVQCPEYAEWQALLNQLVNRAVNANLPDEAVEREAIYNENPL